MLYNEGWFTLSNNVLHKTWQSTCSCKLLPCNIVIMLTWNFWIQFSPSLPCELREPAGGPLGLPVQRPCNTTPQWQCLQQGRGQPQEDARVHCPASIYYNTQRWSALLQCIVRQHNTHFLNLSKYNSALGKNMKTFTVAESLKNVSWT